VSADAYANSYTDTGTHAHAYTDTYTYAAKGD
jgi:hypothetical protein